MLNILRFPDEIKVISEKENLPSAGGDALVRIENATDKIKVFLRACNEKVCFVKLFWAEPVSQETLLLGDAWERSYGDLAWQHPKPERYMPWYFLAHLNGETVGVGVKVRPSSFVCFTCEPNGVTAYFDVRNGSGGVRLNGREILLGEILCESYTGQSAYEAGRAFCRELCSRRCMTSSPVYGSNNWYYAYGNSSAEDILRDASLLNELTEGLENRPYMVIDDGWSRNRCEGPWEPNEKFGDMGSLAQTLKHMGLRPGIWIRPLCDDALAQQHPDWRITVDEPDNAGVNYLDPTVPDFQQYLRGVLRRIKGWGYELIKHDFSSFDLFGAWGSGMGGSVMHRENCLLYDVSITNAEAVLHLYELIREECEDMVIIGCNTFSHLGAGLFELARTGDDTSGRSWDPTRKMGVNTLAFRLMQNGIFYMVDADCVGILGKNIPWELNRQWLDLLTKSGTPLFVSCQPNVIDEQQREDLKAAFERASRQTDTAEPLDWMYNIVPCIWNINGEKTTYDWYTGFSKHTP